MSSYGTVANILDSDVSQLKLQSHYYIHFWTNNLWKGMNTSFSPSYALNSTTLFFYRNNFCIQ